MQLIVVGYQTFCEINVAHEELKTEQFRFHTIYFNYAAKSGKVSH